FAQPPHAGLAGARVDLDPDVGLGAIAALGRLLHRVLHGFDDDHAVDRLFARDGVGDLQQFEPVSTDGHYSISSEVCSSSVSVNSIVSMSSSSSIGFCCWSSRAIDSSASVMTSLASLIRLSGSR